MARRLLKTLAAAAVLAAAAAGCGSDDDPAPAPAGAEAEMSAPERYAKRATAICRRERKAVAAQLAGFPAERAEEAMEEIVLPGFRRQYEGLRRLWPPRGDEDFLDLMLSTLSRSLESGEEDLDRLFRLERSGYSEFGESRVMTLEYGIEGCGSFGRSPQAIYRELKAAPTT